MLEILNLKNLWLRLGSIICGRERNHQERERQTAQGYKERERWWRELQQKTKEPKMVVGMVVGEVELVGP